MGRAVRFNIDTVIQNAEAHYRAGDYAASAALLAPLPRRIVGLPYDANCERFHERQRRVRTASARSGRR
jgi:hypothetical protein